MSSSRRDFLKKGTLVALAAGVPLTVSETILADKRSTQAPGFHLNREQFLLQLNRKFVISYGKKQLRTRLIDVSDIAGSNGVPFSQGKEGFRLTFESEKVSGLEQGTYLVRNPKLGEFSMFIVPSREEGGRSTSYEAIVNRLYP